MKINQVYKRIISRILIFSLILSSVPLSGITVSAGENYAQSGEISEKALEAFEEQLEAATEAVLDDRMPDKAGDWGQAIFKDNLPWNYFHNAVQDEIRNKNGFIGKQELSITYKTKEEQNDSVKENEENQNETTEKKVKKKKNKKTGRADLYQKRKDLTYIWEVKPGSYQNDPNKSLGLAQLKAYVSADSSYRTGNTDSTHIPDGKFVKGKYTITYKNMENGLILYWFERNPEPSSSPNTNLPVGKVDSPSKDDGEDDVGDGADSAINNDTDIAAIVAKAVVCVTVASVIYAEHKAIEHTNSVSATLCPASLAVITTLTAFIANPTEAQAAEVNRQINDYMDIIEAIYDSDFVEKFREAIDQGDSDKVIEIIEDLQENSDDYDDAGDAQPPRDPLILDFGTEGIELKALNHGVNFDLDNNGFAEKTAWIGNEDGFLAYDRNANGKIDNGGELFGDQVIMKNGARSSSGFEALAELDDNQDGIIDKEDLIFNKLQIWIDGNHNGKTDSGELKLLTDLGITTINLDYSKVSIVDKETGTRIAETADVTISLNDTEKTTQISEFWFPVNTTKTTQEDKDTVGNIADIEKAIRDDKSGLLAEYCNQFLTLNDPAMKRYYLKKILYYITGAENISSGSRGGNIDARDLRVIEQFMGRDFVGVGGTNPNVNAANILKRIYANIENQYYCLLNLYGAFGGYLKAVYEYKDKEDKNVLELSLLYYVLDGKMERGDDIHTILYDFGVYLSNFDKVNATSYYNDFLAHYEKKSESCTSAILLAKNGITYLGTDGQDSYGGTECNDFIFGLSSSDSLSGASGNDCINGNEGDDAIYGGAGNDTLYGKSGCDTLNGGAGNDKLSGGKDDDTYIFGMGYGKDTILDCDGLNTLWLKGLHVNDILVNGTGNYDTTIRIKGTADTITFRNFRLGEEFRNYKLKFEDATMYVTDSNSPFRFIYGDSGDDILEAVIEDSYLYGFGGDDTIIGSEGNDLIYGHQGDDYIEAEAGVDRIFSGEGNDVLDGGYEDDYLYGGPGNDTYVFGMNYGTDIISDVEGSSYIEIKDSVSLSELEISYAGENAVISIKDTSDKLIINQFIENEENIFIQCEGQSYLLRDCITSNSSSYYSGTEYSDYFVNMDKTILAGGKSGDQILGTGDGEYLFGDSGEDHLLSNDGNDVVFGDSGDDYINAGDGDDFIDAGSGNDFVDGGAADDLYIFQPGYGKVSIIDTEGNNTITFGDGICADGIKAYRLNWNDLLIRIDQSEDVLIIKNYCIDESSRNFKLEFSDGTVVHALDANSPLRTVNGTDNSEFMYSIYEDESTQTGKEGNDQIVGSINDDYLIGGLGDDRISGNAGNDVLDGGKGNDLLYGDEGNDTYLYQVGYGIDTIGDSQGMNTIMINGYSLSQVKAYRTNWNDVTITFGNEEDKIVIEGFFTSEASRNFYLCFNGGVRIHATAYNSPLRTIYGGYGNEYMVAMDDNDVTLISEACGETLNGGAGNDTLLGSDGNERMCGNGGNDLLNGKGGNDCLYGGAGNDTYIFGKDYGYDIIDDSEGTNTISFENGIVEEDITARRTDWNNLTITIRGIEDQLVILNYFTSSDSRKFNVVFANGMRYRFDDMESPINRIHGTSEDDWMNAWSDDGIVLYGENGNDHLVGGEGNDILSGDEGNDYLAGGNGDDTYLYATLFGNDIISDSQGSNIVDFRENVMEDVTFTVDENGRLIVGFADGDDNVTIEEYRTENFVFYFSDGKTGTVDEVTGEFSEIVEENEGTEEVF